MQSSNQAIKQASNHAIRQASNHAINKNVSDSVLQSRIQGSSAELHSAPVQND
jgi:hypothetical protein